MNFRKIFAGSAGLLVLASCGPDDDEIFPAARFSFGPALTEFFVDDWSVYETAAETLRNSERYRKQRFSWALSSGRTYNSYFLSNANVEFAHAAGLTGAGQTISIIDAGFLPGHLEFSGKTISMPIGFEPLHVYSAGLSVLEKESISHGTAVASVAAGSADFGETIGVAPGADLALGSFDSYNAMTAAVNQAIDLGAIVQNNSWGFELDATKANFNAVFYRRNTVQPDPSPGEYISALKAYANNGVIVFAASNSPNRDKSDLMAALPLILPELEASWLTTVNAAPNIVGSKIVSASRISSGCLEAAAWCLTADGTAYAAIATGSGDYADVVTGTSFAAPQVAGAVALLAEAFPGHSAQELRARILASANNEFFDHTGYVVFAPGVEHGFDEEFGHGFLDLKAALSPIGGSYVPTRRGAAPLEGPVVLSGGMAGDALTTRLAQHDMMIVDGLGGGFEMSADILTATMNIQEDPSAALADLLSADLNGGAIDPFNADSSFSKFVSGQEINLDMDDRRFALLLPAESADTQSFGFSVAREFDLGSSNLSVGLGAMHEDGGFVGMKALAETGSMNADHALASFDWGFPLDSSQEFRLAGTVGMAIPTGEMTAVSMNPVQYNSIKLSYGARDVWAGGDRFSVAFGLPQAVHAGSASVELPTSLTRSGASFEMVDVSLAPVARQMDLTISYGVTLSRRSEIVMSATHSLNDGNVEGVANSVAAIGYRFQF